MFFSGSQKNLSKVISLKTLRNAVQGIKPFLNLPRNPSCLTQEAFTLNSILYDSKIKPQWPGKHILSMNDVDKLLGFIVTLSSSKTNLGRNALKECQNWVLYKKLLQLFFENHNAIGKNNGFGRILKKHLKSGNYFLYLNAKQHFQQSAVISALEI